MRLDVGYGGFPIIILNRSTGWMAKSSTEIQNTGIEILLFIFGRREMISIRTFSLRHLWNIQIEIVKWQLDI